MDATFNGTAKYYRCDVRSFEEGSILAFVQVYMYATHGANYWEDFSRDEIDEINKKIEKGISAGYFGDPDSIVFEIDYFTQNRKFFACFLGKATQVCSVYMQNAKKVVL